MLIRERRNAIQLLIFNRSEKRNALHPDLISGLSCALTDIQADPAIKVVIITGAGSSFCSGLDLVHLGSLDVDGKVAYLRSFFSLFSQIYLLPQPVIAAVNGPALAGGFDLAAACDLRLCSRDATFGQPEVILGLTQIMYPIYKVIGLSHAKELALTGQAISADEAYRVGLVDHVYPSHELLAEVFKLAEVLASRPKQALFATKKLSRDLIELNTESAIKQMFDAISERLGSEEHRGAFEASFAQRKKVTKFTGR